MNAFQLNFKSYKIFPVNLKCKYKYKIQICHTEFTVSSDAYNKDFNFIINIKVKTFCIMNKLGGDGQIISPFIT